MAQEIEFSIMAATEEGLRPLLDEFEAENRIHVRLKLLAWDSAWNDLVKTAIYNDGPDLSEVGNTWIGDLIGMNALRPFQAAEVATIGKPSSFLPSAWKSGSTNGGALEWAVPWLAGARMIFYRPRLLEQAGVDPEHAFDGIDALDQTVSRLHAAGVTVPWTVPTGLTHTTLLNAASWVWAAGGDFLSPDGRSTRFMEPESLAGLRAYFSLGRYLAPQVQGLNGLEPDTFFLENPDTAMVPSGLWLRQQASPRALSEIKASLPPGASFVGGSNLVIWKHSPYSAEALQLVRFLTRAPAQIAYSQFVGLLPVRLDALAAEPFASDPIWQTATHGLSSGRSFPTLRLWGLMEDRLTTAFYAIWNDVLAEPESDPQEAIVKHLGMLARRLDAILKQ